jgi:hypothetical protein
LEKKRKFSIRCLPRGTVFHTGEPEVEQKIGEEEEILHPGEALTQASPVQYTIMELRIGFFPAIFKSTDLPYHSLPGAPRIISYLGNR